MDKLNNGPGGCVLTDGGDIRNKIIFKVINNSDRKFELYQSSLAEKNQPGGSYRIH